MFQNVSANNILSQQANHMLYNTTASLDKVICTRYVDFEKRQDRLGWFCLSTNDSNYFVSKLNKIKKVTTEILA